MSAQLGTIHHRLDALFGTDEAKWAAVAGRDARADGLFVYAVASTGIYCRPVCPARRPRRENASYHMTFEAAERAGFRACKMCRPDRSARPSQTTESAVRPAAILFADIKGFTRIASELPPDEALSLIGQFQSRLGEVVTKAGGVVHKHLGDGFMAVFGDRASMPDDACRALQAALGLRDALAVWNAERVDSGEQPISVGVGLHYGMVAFGMAGGARTIIGDTVNVASRMERLTRRLRTSVLVSDETIRAVPAEVRSGLGGRLRMIGPARLRGSGSRWVWRTIDAADQEQDRWRPGAPVGPHRAAGPPAPTVSSTTRRPSASAWEPESAWGAMATALA